MAGITIRKIGNLLESRVRAQAAVHCRTMEDEVRDILRYALNRARDWPGSLAARTRARFSQHGDDDLPILPIVPPSIRQLF